MRRYPILIMYGLLFAEQALRKPMNRINDIALKLFCMKGTNEESRDKMSSQ